MSLAVSRPSVARQVVAPPRLNVRSRPWLAVVSLLVADVVALSVTLAVCVALRHRAGGQFHPSLYLDMWPALGLFLGGYWLAGLYPGIPYNPVEHLRRVFAVTVGGYLLMGSALFMLREAELYSRLIFIVSCGLSVPMVFFGRAIVRGVLAPRDWWGYPVVVLGGGREGRQVVKLLRRQPGIGLKPVAVVDDEPSPSHRASTFANVPHVHGLHHVEVLAQRYPNLYFILVVAKFPRRDLLELLERRQHLMRHLIVLPDFHGISSLGAAAHDFQGVLGIQLQQRLLDPRRRALKRTIDVAAVLLLLPLVLPVAMLIAALLAVQTRGRVIFRQERVGFGGRPFRVWKFRTMKPNSDHVLEEYLETHPDMRSQWQCKQKVEHDPRVLFMGRWLRRLSLDELPQFWNVLRGDMSLVGPRPIVESELKRYGRHIDLYTQVRPGLTGLWQVSGRNTTSYAERVRLDIYYARNWSLWQDAYILAKTPFVILIGTGAY